MTIEFLRKHKLILLESISGSRAYGLNRPESDTDIRGVFLFPKRLYYGLNYVPQVANESNDIVFYELRRFVELLSKNNPNILELLAIPEDCLIYRHPLMEQLTTKRFLSRLCKDTFAGYAMTQMKKARGLKKKVLNPIEKARKNLLHFCYVPQGQGTLPLLSWLKRHGLEQTQCGLVNLPHMRYYFALFADPTGALGYKGVISGPESNEVLLSSIPKGEKPVTHIYVNHDGYSRYCKEYKEYWEWVDKRNEHRYQATLEHGKRYDAKNMMHTFRLLSMAEEILASSQLNVRRPDREALLAIRDGQYSYEDLMGRAKQKLKQIEKAYQRSSLPDRPDMDQIEALLVSMRKELYQTTFSQDPE
ncbi:MAG: nucleotidyltransferase domain-containing protein [Bacteroidota bacterium]